MEYTFEQLPQAMGQLAAKLDKIEQLLQKQKSPVVQEQDKIISLSEASIFLNLAKATIYGLVSAGKIPYMKQGKKLYFSRQELTAWIQQGRKSVKEDLTTTVDRAIVTAKKRRR